MPVKIFLSYAHEDEALVNEFKKQLFQLQQQDLIDVWYDRDIRAGTEWAQDISKHLNEAQIILLLISPDFMNSDYCYGIELNRAIERHERDEARVIPIILRPACWQKVLGKFQALPKDALPVTDWPNWDKAFLNVAEGIRKVVEEISNQPFEQRKRILQILYEKRFDPLQTLDREDLARLIGKPWYEVQPDVAYLEEKGHLVTKHSQIRARIFHRLSITLKGVEFVEKPPKPPLRRIEVFISSPGDVSEERQIVKLVIERCNRLHAIAERYVLRPLAYEESVPAEVGKRPQTIVDQHMMKASSSDLLICMLWHRMGTPVTHEETGERFQSGTEYEFLDAYRHNQLHEKPYILLYRCMKPYPPEADPQQWRAVEAFFKRFEGEHAELKGIYKRYHSNEEFGEELFQDINAALSKNLIL